MWWDFDFDDLILVVLSISTFSSVLIWTGFMPAWITKRLAKNRLTETVLVLREFGIDVEKYRKLNLSRSVDNHVDANNIERSLSRILDGSTIKKRVHVGKTDQVEVDHYVDAMSLSTGPSDSVQLARILASFWRKKLSEEDPTIRIADFDYIVTPKEGSPILGYEFSKILGKPLILHCGSEKKFETGCANLAFQSTFDTRTVPKAGAKVILVDDSTTGGRKVRQAIDDLRRNEIVVHDCLVLFEPTVKNVRKRVEEMDVSLHAVIRK
ncbi:phosphoribosyltransferase [Marinobacter xiaoshiensis]|uniref:Phosphoribosyltransferase domain-containing protein n=1 Tax=Marinobacter xiaoshiensis TaxID=3073652 RepID=A0ABU2HK98_9GAMM|nr:hypothetical protein [Marinobacter sp. F60267]MDS1311494.1 hypothetical protein [Marinobacter sp. F60267]